MPGWCRTRDCASASSAPIEAEWQRTVDALALITGEKQRLAGNPALARSIKHRFPYIDPLHHLQVELVRRWREAQTTSASASASTCRSTASRRALRNTG
jgi:phosphoenolpyruvate carboxylase